MGRLRNTTPKRKSTFRVMFIKRNQEEKKAIRKLYMSMCVTYVYIFPYRYVHMN